MIIDCISDCHGYAPELDGGDLLIIAGDITACDSPSEWFCFNDWLMRQKYSKKIIIAGNHDGYLEKQKAGRRYFSVGCYLQDSLEEYEGLKIWGSPWTPTFFNWHFMKDRGEDIKKMWDLIPDDIDILITHGPPFGIQDEVKYSSKANNGKSAGCEELRVALNRLKNLKLHVFGHIHECYGKVVVNGVTHVNACIMNEDYIPVNKPIRVIL